MTDHGLMKESKKLSYEQGWDAFEVLLTVCSSDLKVYFCATRMRPEWNNWFNFSLCDKKEERQEPDYQMRYYINRRLEDRYTFRLHDETWVLKSSLDLHIEFDEVVPEEGCFVYDSEERNFKIITHEFCEYHNSNERRYMQACFREAVPADVLHMIGCRRSPGSDEESEEEKKLDEH